MIKGNYFKTRKYCKKALELNPESTIATLTIERMSTEKLEL
jgi:hypothetical protein